MVSEDGPTPPPTIAIPEAILAAQRSAGVTSARVSPDNVPISPRTESRARALVTRATRGSTDIAQTLGRDHDA